jgi:hypothetical protein
MSFFFCLEVLLLCCAWGAAAQTPVFSSTAATLTEGVSTFVNF